MIDVAAVYERYAKDVYRFALCLSGNRALAEDIASETFARAWVARDQIRVGTVKAYLLMITRNLYRDGQRRDWRAQELDMDVTDPHPDPEAATADRVMLGRVLDALGQLPEADRAARLLSAQEGLTSEEIAATLGALFSGAAPSLPPDHEARTFVTVRKRLRGHPWLLQSAALFSCLAFGRIVSDTSWDVSPRNFIITAAIAGCFWIAYGVSIWRLRRRLLRDPRKTSVPTPG